MWSSAPFPKMSASSGRDYFSLTPLSQELHTSEFLMSNWGYVGAKAPFLSTTPPFVTMTQESDDMWRYPSGYLYKRFSVNPDPWSQMVGRDTQVVIRINTLLLILTREVRWHAGVPYGYLHLLSPRGKRAHWHAETNVIIYNFCQPEANESVDTQRLTSSSAPFVIQRWWVRWHAEIPKWLSVQMFFC